MSWLGVNWNDMNIMQMSRWIIGRYKGSKFKRQVVMAAYAAVVYLFSTNRNKAFWDSVISTIDHTVKEIKYISNIGFTDYESQD